MKNDLSIYIHMPFCVRKCLYCDFLSGPFDDSVKKAYLESLLKEADSYCDLFADRRIVSIYIGGGTPSLLPSSHIASIIKKIRGMAELSKDCEISVEINPGTLDEKKAEDYLDCGINRFSLGLQSVNDNELKALGRIHDYNDFLSSYRILRDLGAGNINVDLMTGIPHEDRISAKRSLDMTADLGPEHISVYSLILEEGTAFFEKGEKELYLPDEDEEDAIYEMTRRILRDKGYERYEISNYAKNSCECRHNMVYWDCGDYIGLGAAAASRLKNRRFSNVRDLAAYISRPVLNRDEDLLLDEGEYMSEFIFMGLRKVEGISLKDFEARFGRDIMDVYAKVIKEHEKKGMLCLKDGRMFLSERGMDVSNIILADYIF